VLTSVVLVQLGVPSISLCVMGGAALYSGYTVVLTRLRTAQRREQNGATKDAQELVVDSLLCFETVKLFACEQAEAYLPYISPRSPLELPYISAVSRASRRRRRASMASRGGSRGCRPRCRTDSPGSTEP